MMCDIWPMQKYRKAYNSRAAIPIPLQNGFGTAVQQRTRFQPTERVGATSVCRFMRLVCMYGDFVVQTVQFKHDFGGVQETPVTGFPGKLCRYGLIQ